jgi:hypothetical protein
MNDLETRPDSAIMETATMQTQEVVNVALGSVGRAKLIRSQAYDALRELERRRDALTEQITDMREQLGKTFVEVTDEERAEVLSPTRRRNGGRPRAARPLCHECKREFPKRHGLVIHGRRSGHQIDPDNGK